MATRTERTKSSFDEEKGTVHLKVLSNEGRDDQGNQVWNGVGEREFSFGDLPKEIQQRCALFGFQQVLLQRASDESGEDKLSAFENVADSLKQGHWTRRSGGAGGGPVPVYVQAIARIYGVSESEAMRSVQAYSNDQKEKLKNSPKVKEEIQKIQGESRGSAGPDLSDLM